MRGKTSFAILGTLMAGILALPGAANAFDPSDQVECIAPANPGGGWDFTCRSVGKILFDLKLVPAPIQVTNMPGAGGGVAYGHTVSKRGEDANLLVAASSATTTRLALGQFVDLSADQVRWPASLGADFGIIAVGKDSPYKNLNDLVEAVKKDPEAVNFAGGSPRGGWDHFKVLILGKAAGIDKLNAIKYVSFNSGGAALTQVIGGHVQAFTGDISEVVGQIQAGNTKVLAVLSPERLPGDFSDIPTAVEQGYEGAIGANWRGFYLPKDISDDAYEKHK